jgi:peptide/nickel transport system permease protein
MLAFILQRAAQAAGVVLVVSFVSFGLFNYVGDPVNNMVGQEASLADREQLRRDLGLDDPVVVQFARFLGNALQGDFGLSPS